jgi:hypothetical protein
LQNSNNNGNKVLANKNLPKNKSNSSNRSGCRKNNTACRNSNNSGNKVLASRSLPPNNSNLGWKHLAEEKHQIAGGPPPGDKNANYYDDRTGYV